MNDQTHLKTSNNLRFRKPFASKTPQTRQHSHFQEESLHEILFPFLENLCDLKVYNQRFRDFNISDDQLEKYSKKNQRDLEQLKKIRDFMGTVKMFYEPNEFRNSKILLSAIRQFIYYQNLYSQPSIYTGDLKNIIRDLLLFVHQGFLLDVSNEETLTKQNSFLGSCLEKSKSFFDDDDKYEIEIETDLCPRQIDCQNNNFFTDLYSSFNFRQGSLQDPDTGEMMVAEIKHWIIQLPEILPVFLQSPQNLENEGEFQELYQIQKEFYVDEFLLENKRKFKQALKARKEGSRSKADEVKEEINQLENYGDSKAPLNKIFADALEILSDTLQKHPHVFTTTFLDDPNKSLNMLNQMKNNVEQKLNSLKIKEKEGANRAVYDYLIPEICKTKYVLSNIIAYSKSTTKYFAFYYNYHNNKLERLQEGQKYQMSLEELSDHSLQNQLYPVCLTYVKAENLVQQNFMSSSSKFTSLSHQEIYPYQTSPETTRFLNLDSKDFAQKLYDRFKTDYNDRNQESNILREKDIQTDFMLMKPVLPSFKVFLEKQNKIYGITIERFILANVFKAYDLDINRMSQHRTTQFYKSFAEFFPYGKWEKLLQEERKQEELIRSRKERYQNILQCKNILINIFKSILQEQSTKQTSYLFYQFYIEHQKIEDEALKQQLFQFIPHIILTVCLELCGNIYHSSFTQDHEETVISNLKALGDYFNLVALFQLPKSKYWQIVDLLKFYMELKEKFFITETFNSCSEDIRGLRKSLQTLDVPGALFSEIKVGGACSQTKFEEPYDVIKSPDMSLLQEICVIFQKKYLNWIELDKHISQNKLDLKVQIFEKYLQRKK